MNPEHTERWRQIFRAFDPRQPLSPELVDELYVERPQAASSRIINELQLDLDSTALYILCGSRGSGKSTELIRIQRRLRCERVILRLDLQQLLPEPYSPLGLILVLGLAGLHAAESAGRSAEDIQHARKEFEDAIKSLSQGEETLQLDVGQLVANLAGLVAVTAPTLGSAGAAVAGAAIVAKKVASATRLIWSRSVGRRALDASEQARFDILAAVNAILKLIRSDGGPVLILADGLDKLTALPELITLLNDPKLLGSLDHPLVLTGPVNLLHNTEFNGLRSIATTAPLYNIAVRTRKGREDPEGLKILEKIARQREQNSNFKTPWIESEALESLALSSGGSTRDFIELIRDSARDAWKSEESVIKNTHAINAVKTFRHNLQFPLNEHSVEQLRQVLQKQRPTADSHCESLLFNNYILCYPDGDLWYRPHEALIAWLEGDAS